MELPDVGQQCGHFDCKQLDFLPLQCKCGKNFCSEHFNEHVSVCNSVHRIEVEKRKIENIYKCSSNNCNESSLVPLICEKCHQHFCIKHRHISQCTNPDEQQIAKEKEKITAPIRQFNEAKSVVDQQIEHKLKEAKRKGKNNSLANKVQLMKLKSKAKGLNTISTMDRVYFSVTHPDSAQVNSVFVSKNWSLGRTIDAIANEFKLQNDNNKNTGKKLRLLKKDNGETISKNLAEPIDLLISKGLIMDGDNLVITHVNSDN